MGEMTYTEYYAGLPEEQHLRGDSNLLGKLLESKPKSTTLTGRERQVVACAALGMTNEETAAEVGVAIETVKSHWKHVLAKTHARNRTHAVALWLAHQVGETTQPDPALRDADAAAGVEASSPTEGMGSSNWPHSSPQSPQP